MLYILLADQAYGSGQDYWLIFVSHVNPLIQITDFSWDT